MTIAGSSGLGILNRLKMKSGIRLTRFPPCWQHMLKTHFVEPKRYIISFRPLC